MLDIVLEYCQKMTLYNIENLYGTLLSGTLFRGLHVILNAWSNELPLPVLSLPSFWTGLPRTSRSSGALSLT